MDFSSFTAIVEEKLSYVSTSTAGSRQQMEALSVEYLNLYNTNLDRLRRESKTSPRLKLSRCVCVQLHLREKDAGNTLSKMTVFDHLTEEFGVVMNNSKLLCRVCRMNRLMKISVLMGPQIGLRLF